MGQQRLLLPFRKMPERSGDRRALLFFEESLIRSVDLVYPDYAVLVSPLGVLRPPHRSDHVPRRRNGVGSSIPGSMRFAAASTLTSVSWTRSSAAASFPTREKTIRRSIGNSDATSGAASESGRAPSSSAPSMTGTLRPITRAVFAVNIGKACSMRFIYLGGSGTRAELVNGARLARRSAGPWTTSAFNLETILDRRARARVRIHQTWVYQS